MKPDCAQVHLWTEAYIDQELDLAHALEVESTPKVVFPVETKSKRGKRSRKLSDPAQLAVFLAPKGFRRKTPTQS